MHGLHGPPHGAVRACVRVCERATLRLGVAHHSIIVLTSSIFRLPPQPTSAYGIPDPILQRAEALGHAFDATCRPAISLGTEGNVAALTVAATPSTTAAAAAAAAATKAPLALTLEGAAAVLQRVAGGYEQQQEGATAALASSLAQVAPGFDPSPALEGQACVYLLRVPSGAGAASAASFYVGETESIRRRLEQHRCVWLFE